MATAHCLNCDKAFYVPPSDLKRGWGKYCSRTCYIKVRRKNAPTKETLQKLYLQEKLSSRDIAKKFNLSKSFILTLLGTYAIAIRTNAEARRLLWKRSKYRKNVITRLRGRQYFNTSRWEGISKEELKRLYYKEGKSSKEIAEQFGITATTILQTMRKYAIPRRTKQQLAQRSLGRRNSPTTEFKNGDTPWWIKRGLPNPAEDPQTLKKMLHIQKPTKAERKFIKITKDKNFDLKYVGNGKVVVGGKCPDFINSERKKIIEIFGRYWHDPSKNPNVRSSRTYNAIIKHYKKYGYDSLIIWADEIDNTEEVVERVERFISD